MKYLPALTLLIFFMYFSSSFAWAKSHDTINVSTQLLPDGKVVFLDNSKLQASQLLEKKIILGLETDRVQIKIIDQPRIEIQSIELSVDLKKLNLKNYNQISTKNYYLHGIGQINQKRKESTISFFAEKISSDSLWTIELIFPKGILKPTFWSKLMFWSANSSIIWFIISIFLLIIVNLILLFVLTRRFYSDLISRSTKIIRAPPSDLYSPAVALLEHQNDTPRAIAAGILYLAARGYLIVIKKNNHFYIAKCHEPPDYLILDCEIYNLFFGRWFAWSEKEIKIKSSTDIFNEMAGEIYHYIYYDLQNRRLFIKDYRLTIHKTRVLGILLFIISFIMFTVSLNVLPYPPYASLIWISLIISSAIIIHISKSFSIRTNKGSKERKRWQSFKNYLSNIFSISTSDLPLDIYLHYAVALGCEKQWVNRFESNKNPVWFKNFDNTSGTTKGIEIVNFVLELCCLINEYKPPEEI